MMHEDGRRERGRKKKKGRDVQGAWLGEVEERNQCVFENPTDTTVEEP
jgi:hypothetical protein